MRLDEDDFLAAWLPRLGGAADVVVPPGDDCAAVAWRPGQLLLLAADQVAAGVHFYARGTAHATSPAQVGRKLLARNLSDVAAMAGRPTWALLTVAVEADCPRAWLDDFMHGLLALANEYGVRVVGGDTGRAAATVASLTILGTVSADLVCRRDAARPDDRLFVTGACGGSLPSGHHLTFAPRLAEGAWLAEHGFTRCLIDTSDGLLKDLGRVCAASGVDARLEEAQVPRRQVDGVPVSLAAAFLDGEDYELLAAVPAAHAPRLAQCWPFRTPLTEIGSFVPCCDAAGPAVRDLAGEPLLSRYGPGFRHF